MNTLFYQLEMDQSLVNCGMSYVFRLINGEYVIIDGGYFTDGEEDRLYNFLKNSSDDKPRIRGWFFTHAHQDHIGCFINFIEKYNDKVIIDKLYYNFQPTRHRFAMGSWKKKSNDLATVKHFYKIIKKYSSFFEIHTLRTNERFDIEELHFTVLYTADDIYPKKVSFNDYSAVFSVETGGQKILFLGDVQKEGSAILLRDKKDSLPSDIVQVAHHGFRGATKELYAAIHPTVALFPTPDFEFEKNKSSEVNDFILNGTGINKYYVGGCGDTMFTLPGDICSAEQYDKQFFGKPDGK